MFGTTVARPIICVLIVVKYNGALFINNTNINNTYCNVESSCSDFYKIER